MKSIKKFLLGKWLTLFLGASMLVGAIIFVIRESDGSFDYVRACLYFLISASLILDFLKENRLEKSEEVNIPIEEYRRRIEEKHP